jgi:DNA polymerase-1
MDKLVLIDGNSIMNRAFYGIMGSKTLTSKDGKFTNAIYGFLAILFKLLDEEKPQYLGVSFDLKAPTERHKMYEGYKANRKGMPEELAYQMPIIKDILKAMNIDIIEKEGYEGDDIIGTLSRYGSKRGLEVVILSGDRDTFQLATDKIKIKIPRTKAGKTETEVYDESKIMETYGIKPRQLIEVKGLQGDTSDNIPGVPGIGEKTALTLIKKYKNIDNLYKKLESGETDIKGKQKEKLLENKELAFLSRTLGEINLKVPIEDTLEELKIEEWDREKVLEIFQSLNFKRYIERFNLLETRSRKSNFRNR